MYQTNQIAISDIDKHSGNNQFFITTILWRKYLHHSSLFIADYVVAFYATRSSIVRGITGARIIFDFVVLNTDKVYDATTGVFRCHAAGTYVFTWTVKIDKHYLHSILLKNGVTVGMALSGDGEYLTSGTNTAILNLEPGDEMSVSTGEHCCTVNIQSTVTSFSGFLLL